MQFDFLNPNDTAIWDDFVAKSPQGSIFATSQYLDAVQAKYRIGVLTGKGRIMAGIVLARNELRTFSNPLLVKYLGVLFAPSNKKTKYVTEISRERNICIELINYIKPYYTFDYTFHPNFTNWLPFHWAGFRQETRYTYIFNDISSIEALLQGADSRVRNTLRKAEKNNISIINKIDVDAFYKVNRLSFARQSGNPPYSLEKLRNMYDILSATNSIHLLGAVDKSGRLLSVAGIVNDHRCSYLLLNGTDYRVTDVGANTKLIVEAIKFCSNLAPRFDFEGSMIKNIEFFYQSFGAVQTPYFSIWRDNTLVQNKRRLINLYKKIKYRK